MLKFEKSHGGRENYFSVKLKKDMVGDCSTRAIAIATGLDYMEVMKMQFAKGLEMGCMPNNDDIIEAILIEQGFVKNSPKIKKGTKRKKYKLKTFPADSNEVYVVRLAGHIVTVKNGTVMDTWDCREWAAQSYYTKRK